MAQLSGTEWQREVCATVATELLPLVDMLLDVELESAAADLRRVARMLEARHDGWPELHAFVPQVIA